VSSDHEFVADVARQLAQTASRPQMSVDEAMEHQFRLVETAAQVMGSDEVFVEDYGQVRELATVGFGGGGRPRATARVEEVLARFFGTEEAVLVHGAGTGSIRAMLNAMVEPGSRVLLHQAHPYKTTLPTMQHMGLGIDYVDFNDSAALEAALRSQSYETVFVQHVPQQLGDRYSITDVIDITRSVCGEAVRVLIDDNYAVMRSPAIGVEMGADASALSLFKLLAPEAIGAVLADGASVAHVRRDNASAGAQVQGPSAMAALRALIYAPVALAIQDQVILRTVDEINAGVSVRRPAGHPLHRPAVRPTGGGGVPALGVAPRIAEPIHR